MNHNLAVQAFQTLYPARQIPQLELKYHGRLRGHNATVRANSKKITFRLSNQFIQASDEIKIGVMQYLLNRLYKTKHKTLEIDLYSQFTKKLTQYATINHIDPLIEERFNILNKEYFNAFMMTPNLVWGTASIRKLGHYEFSTDTISLSTVLKEDQDMLDYVLYHEMLHKKLGYSESAGGITRTHTPEFRRLERQFKIKDIEHRLHSFLRQRKYKKPAKATHSKTIKPKTFIQRLINYWEL